MLKDIYIYNTLSREKEKFVARTKNEVKMYACGPTVYNYIHLGNARPFIVFDLMRRVFEKTGYQVTFVQNFTDIDDKVIKKANEEQVDFQKIAERYINEYFHDAKQLKIRKATHHPLATESMPTIIEIIQTLIDKGHAYIKDDGVYFDTKTFADYGKLSRLTQDELLDGASDRNVSFSDKKSPHDFVLWKFKKPEEPFFPSPFGDGRPGWHIECSAMIKQFLGNDIDLHCGGQDLVFPHHENEIAQSECSCGHHFARYWMHNGFINVNHEKMSKSRNNFFLVRTLAEQYSYEVIRYFILTAQYRNPINFSDELLKAAEQGLTRLKTAYQDAINLLKSCQETNSFSEAINNKLPQDEKITQLTEGFYDSLRDDLNTPEALAFLFNHVRELNKLTKLITEQQKQHQARDISAEDIEKYQLMILALKEMTDFLDISLANDTIPQEVKNLVEQRIKAKQAKDFQKADELRELVKNLGYQIKDTAQGAVVTKL